MIDTSMPVRIAARVLGAVVGGYVLTAGFVSLFSVLLVLAGMVRSEAAVLATMLGFIVYLIALIWGFATPRLRTLWTCCAVGAIGMGAFALLLKSTLLLAR